MLPIETPCVIPIADIILNLKPFRDITDRCRVATFIFAYNLILFCCLRRAIEASCHKQDSLMRSASPTVSRDKQTPPLSAITLLHHWNVDSIGRSSSDWCQSHKNIGRKSRFLRQLGDTGPNIAVTFGVEKIERCGYPIVTKFRGYDSSFWHNTWTWRRARQTDGRTPLDGIGRPYS